MEYDLRGWMNPGYHGPDVARRAAPLLKASYRGWVRPPAPAGAGADGDGAVGAGAGEAQS